MSVLLGLMMMVCGSPADAAKTKERDAFSRPKVSRSAPPQLKQKLMTYWLECTNGKVQECLVLGDAYEKGHGLDTNQRYAADLYQRACEPRKCSHCLG